MTTHTIPGFPAAAAAAAAVKLLLLLLLQPSDLLKHRLQYCSIYAVICAAIAWNLFRLSSGWLIECTPCSCIDFVLCSCSVSAWLLCSAPSSRAIQGPSRYSGTSGGRPAPRTSPCRFPFRAIFIAPQPAASHAPGRGHPARHHLLFLPRCSLLRFICGRSFARIR